MSQICIQKVFEQMFNSVINFRRVTHFRPCMLETQVTYYQPALFLFSRYVEASLQGWPTNKCDHMSQLGTDLEKDNFCLKDHIFFKPKIHLPPKKGINIPQKRLIYQTITIKLQKSQEIGKNAVNKVQNCKKNSKKFGFNSTRDQTFLMYQPSQPAVV